VSLDPGALLIRQGDAGDRFYVLESGSLAVSIDGLPVRALDHPGDGVGEIALLRDVPRTATVIAGSACVLLSLERHDFLEAVTGHEVALAAGLRSADARLSGQRPDASRGSEPLQHPFDP
jgi:CRP-like cAMP-binding protein